MKNTQAILWELIQEANTALEQSHLNHVIHIQGGYKPPLDMYRIREEQARIISQQLGTELQYSDREEEDNWDYLSFILRNGPSSFWLDHYQHGGETAAFILSQPYWRDELPVINVWETQEVIIQTENDFWSSRTTIITRLPNYFHCHNPSGADNNYALLIYQDASLTERILKLK